jgi:hypothetical protein
VLIHAQVRGHPATAPHFVYSLNKMGYPAAATAASRSACLSKSLLTSMNSFV